jgi:putative endonuclease
MPYSVYLLRCADGTLYAGSTTDPARRAIEHNSSARGAKYTHSRRPVVLVYEEVCGTRSEAQKRESSLKKMTRAQKEALLASSKPLGDTV